MNRTTLRNEGAALVGRTIRFTAPTPHYGRDHIELTVTECHDNTQPGGTDQFLVFGNVNDVSKRYMEIGLPAETSIEFVDDVEPGAES